MSKRLWWGVGGLVVVSGLGAGLRLGAAQGPRDAAGVCMASPQARYGALPLHFEPQPATAQFIARGPRYALQLTPAGASLLLQPPAPEVGPPAPAGELRLVLEQANPQPLALGEQRLPGYSNYFHGKDPAQWRTRVPHYAKLRYREVYPGVDLVYYGRQQQLEYDFVVAPGADPAQIRLRYEGARQASLDAQGDLHLQLAGGEVLQQAPRVYQTVGGERRRVDGRYRLEQKAQHIEVAFALGAYDRSRPLVIDPVVSYSSYLGGDGSDNGMAVAVDGSGAAYVAGTTSSANFPVTAGAATTTMGGFSDVFVAKLDPSGTALQYATFLGGTDFGSDLPSAIAVDGSGRAYVAGTTSSADFPVSAAAFQRERSGQAFAGTGFVTRLAADGAALDYSTYFGGDADFFFASIVDLAIDSAGAAYLAGATGSRNFPITAAAYQTILKGGRDIFVAKLKPDGSGVEYSTFLGGSDNGFEFAAAIGVDSAGSAYVAGFTSVSDFPVTPGAFDTTFGFGKAYVSKLDPTGSTLLYSTFFPGSIADLAVSAGGTAYIAGGGSSATPTTPGAFDTSAASAKGYIAQLNAAGNGLVYATRLGSDTGSTTISAIAVDASGHATVVGNTSANDHPLTADAPQTLRAGGQDVFVTRLDPAGSALGFSSYLGGEGSDSASDVALDGAGDFYITGNTQSTAFPVSGALQPMPGADVAGGSGSDAFISNSVPAVLLSPVVESGSSSGSEASGQAVLRFRRAGTRNGALGVDYATGDLTGANAALAGSDYGASSGTVSWADGDIADKFVTITVLNDTVQEPGEQFQVTLSNATGGARIAAPNPVLVFIGDDDGPTTTGPAEVSVSAGTRSEERGTLTVFISRDGDLSAPASVMYATLDDTALAGSDYTAVSGTVSWAAGDGATRSVDVPILDDTLGEDNEQFQVLLSNAAGATIDNDLADALIYDNDVLKLLQFPGVAVVQVNEGEGNALLRVTRAGNSFGAVSVDFGSSDLAAQAGSDYVASSGTLNWGDADNQPKYISVPVTDDTLIEGSEDLQAALANPAGATLGSPTTQRVVIVDNDDAPGTLQFSAATYLVSESGGSATIAVTRLNGSRGAVSAFYFVSGGTATSGSDYTGSSGSLNWADGETAPKTFTISIADDALREGNETVGLNLSSSSLGAPSKATLVIQEDDTPGTLAFDSGSYSVDETAGTATITVQRLSGSVGAASVQYATAAGSAAAGSDFTPVSGTLSWADGDAASKSFTVPILDDAEVEGLETVALSLSAATGATLGSPANAILTIVSEDTPPPPFGNLRFAAAGYSVGEGGAQATILVSRVGGSTGAVSVDYMTANGSALSGTDYVAASGTLSWADGDAGDRSFTVMILDDAVVEGDEALDLALANPQGGATLGSPAAATLAIVDDEAVLALEADSYRVDEAAGNAIITVVRRGGSAGAVSATLSVTPGTATAGADFDGSARLVSFGAGDSAPKTVLVPIVDDADVEPQESVNLAMGSPVGASIGTPATAVLDIVDDDMLSVISFGADEFAGLENAGTAQLTVTRSAGKRGVVTVRFATSDGTAVGGRDYEPVDTVLRFEDGEFGTRLVEVRLLDNPLPGPDRTIRLKLSEVTGAVLVPQKSDSATLKLVDDETLGAQTAGGDPQAEEVCVDDPQGVGAIDLPMLLSILMLSSLAAGRRRRSMG